MKTEIRILIEQQKAGKKLSPNEIRTLMLYAKEILKEFEGHTLASIKRAHKLIGEQYKKAA